tara:strand:- start:170 stop:1006 length:837 start_codon:yes stop_codon:yes gene_type:complete
MKILTISFILFLLVIPISFAESDFSFWDFGDDLIDAFYQKILDLINFALSPLQNLVEIFLTEPVQLGLFKSLWAIMIYIISLFYGLFLMFAGFKFIFSGFSVEKRYQAKEWLKNALIMIIAVQASFLLYDFTLQIFSGLSLGVLELLPSNFFQLTGDNYFNFALNLFLGAVYLFVLIVYVILMGVRYLLVSAGVIFVPIGIFLYLIPPLHNFGKMILSMLLLLMSIPFFQAIIFLAGSKLLSIPFFAEIKIVVMIVSFVLAIIFFIVVLLFVYVIPKV